MGKYTKSIRLAEAAATAASDAEAERFWSEWERITGVNRKFAPALGYLPLASAVFPAEHGGH